jgi:hypothetical protein
VCLCVCVLCVGARAVRARLRQCVCVCVCASVCVRVRVGSHPPNAPIVSTHFLLDVSVEVDDECVWRARNATPLLSSNVVLNSSGACSVSTVTYETPVVLSAMRVAGNLLSTLRDGVRLVQWHISGYTDRMRGRRVVAKYPPKGYGVCVCVCARHVCMCLHACAYVCVCVCMRVRMYAHGCVRACVWVWVRARARA